MLWPLKQYASDLPFTAIPSSRRFMQIITLRRRTMEVERNRVEMLLCRRTAK
jgi:hypothetical protein